MNEAMQEELELIEGSSQHSLTLPDYDQNLLQHSLIDGSSSLSQLAHHHSVNLSRGGKASNMHHMVSRSQALDLQKVRSQKEKEPEDFFSNQQNLNEDFNLGGISLSKSYIYNPTGFINLNAASQNRQKNQSSAVNTNPNFFYSTSAQGDSNLRGRHSQGGKNHIRSYNPLISDRFDFDHTYPQENLQVEDFSPPENNDQWNAKEKITDKDFLSFQRKQKSNHIYHQAYQEVQSFPSILPSNQESEKMKGQKQSQVAQGLMVLDDDFASSKQNHNFAEFDEFIENSHAIDFQVKVQNFINESAGQDSIQNLNNANNQDQEQQSLPRVNNLFSIQNMIVSQQKTQRSITEILDASENKRLETDEYEDDFEELDEDENRRWAKIQNVANSNMQGFSEEKKQCSFTRREQDDIEANHDQSSSSPTSFLRKPFNQQAQDTFSYQKNNHLGDQYHSTQMNANHLLSSQQTVFAADQHHIVSNQIESPKHNRDRDFRNGEENKEISEIDFFSQDQTQHNPNQMRVSLNSTDMHEYWNQSMQQKNERAYLIQQSNTQLDEEEIKLETKETQRIRSQEQRTSQNSVMSNYLSDSESRVLRSSHPTEVNILQINLHSRGREQSSVKLTKQKSEDFYNQFELEDQQEEQKFNHQQSAHSINLPLQYAQSEKILNKYDDQSEPLLQRGRNSVLEEVEDDDIVNQNSSKSTSKAHSQERQNRLENRLEIANHILQSFSQTSHENLDWNLNGLQLVHQRQVQIESEEIIEEIKAESDHHLNTHKQKPHKIISGILTQERSMTDLQNMSGKSSVSSRRKRQTKETKHGTLKFTYFASSSLSDDRWLCPICLDIFEDAVETPCCHNLFCDECIKKTPTCPLCNLRINGQLKPNIPIRRLVNELSINCINQYCEDVIRKGDLDKHLKVCLFTPVICPNNDVCGKYIRKDIEKHKNEECSFRIVECLLKCGLMLPLNDMEDHIAQDCPKFQVKCKNNCQGTIERGEMDKHISIDCPLQIVDCPNKIDSLFEESCQVRLKRKEMETHKLTCNYRRVYCQNQKCGSIIIYKDLLSHDERCLFKIVDCDNRCGIKVQRQYLEKHKEVCENQLMKCSYYDHGCKVEILRKYYLQHLQEEAFNHSIIFIEGQKKRNREMEELKFDFLQLRQNYDVEIQAMFLELHRLKDEMTIVKQKSGINPQAQGASVHPNSTNNNPLPGAKLILGNNAGLGGINIQRNRLEPVNSSVGSNNYEQSRGANRPFWLENWRSNNGQSNAAERQSLQHVYERERLNGFSFLNNGISQNQAPHFRWANPNESHNGANSNTASLAQSAQSFDHFSLGFGQAQQNNQRNAQKPPTYRQGWMEDSGNNNPRNQRQENYQSRQGYWFQNSSQNQISSNQNDIFSFITNRNNNNQNNQNTNINDQVNRRLPFTFHSSNNNIGQNNNSNANVQSSANANHSNNNGNNNNHASNYSRFTFNSNQIDQNHQENESYSQIVRYGQNQGDQSNGGMNDHSMNRNLLSSDQEAENRKNQLAALFLGSMNGSVDSISGLSMMRGNMPSSSQIGGNSSQVNSEQLQNVHQQLFQSYQNLYNHRQSIGENGPEDQRMSFGFAHNSSSPQINHASSSPLPSSSNIIHNQPRTVVNASSSSNFNQSNNMQGSQQSGMNLGGVVAHQNNAESSFGVIENQLSGIGVGGSINLDGGRSQTNTHLGGDNMSETALIQRSMGNMGGGINNLSKNLEMSSQNVSRSNNMRNVAVMNQNQVNNQANPNSFHHNNQRRFQYNLSSSNSGQVIRQSSRRISQEGLGGMNDIIESQENPNSIVRGNTESNKPKNMQNVLPTNQDLDSSNVIYDDDFEIEEEKNDY